MTTLIMGSTAERQQTLHVISFTCIAMFYVGISAEDDWEFHPLLDTQPHLSTTVRVARRSTPSCRMDEVFPLADANLTSRLYTLILDSFKNKQLRRGTAEAAKGLERQRCEFVVIAKDTNPFMFVQYPLVLCLEKRVPYVFVPSQKDLGVACGHDWVPLMACAVLVKNGSSLQPRIDDVKEEIWSLHNHRIDPSKYG